MKFLEYACRNSFSRSEEAHSAASRHPRLGGQEGQDGRFQARISPELPISNTRGHTFRSDTAVRKDGPEG